MVESHEEDSETAGGVDADGAFVRHGRHHNFGGDVSRSRHQGLRQGEEISPRDVSRPRVQDKILLLAGSPRRGDRGRLGEPSLP